MPAPVRLPDGTLFVGQQQISVVKTSDHNMSELFAMDIEGKTKYATKEFLSHFPHYNKFVIG